MFVRKGLTQSLIDHLGSAKNYRMKRVSTIYFSLQLKGTICSPEAEVFNLSLTLNPGLTFWIKEGV